MGVFLYFPNSVKYIHSQKAVWVDILLTAENKICSDFQISFHFQILTRSVLLKYYFDRSKQKVLRLTQKNEKLKRLTTVISSHKYVVSALHNFIKMIPFVRIIEQDERRKWRHIKILLIVIKTTSCQTEAMGLQCSVATI